MMLLLMLLICDVITSARFPEIWLRGHKNTLKESIPVEDIL